MGMRNLLEIKLLSQPFGSNLSPNLQLQNAKLIAKMYSDLENCISVLSDLKTNRSCIFNGAVAQQFGLSTTESEISTIWEDELLEKVHPDDLERKYSLEFKFFQLLNKLDARERLDYEVLTKLRIKNVEGKYVFVKHRLLYIANSKDGSVWLALCLYNIIYDHPEFTIPKGAIINKITGKVVDLGESEVDHVLSAREKEIIKLIRQGVRSKEIAGKLSISINTVNRHRQNIFQKLNATNAMEACVIAKRNGLVD